jgi:hypothetical protein
VTAGPDKFTASHWSANFPAAIANDSFAARAIERLELKCPLRAVKVISRSHWNDGRRVWSVRAFDKMRRLAVQNIKHSP